MRANIATVTRSVWIIKGKALLQKDIRNYSSCKQRRVTLQPPFMSDLPEARLVINETLFTNVGIDCFEPLTMKKWIRTRSTDGTSKRCGAISTCLSTRVVYMELIGNLSTGNFILVLLQLIFRRGHRKKHF